MREQKRKGRKCGMVRWISLICLIILLLPAQRASAQLPDSLLIIKKNILLMDYDSLLELPMETVVKLARITGVSVDELFNMLVSTAGIKKEKVSEVPASVVVITREEIESSGYQSVSEILEHVPGLYPMDNLFFFGPSFGVRGFWNDQENSNLMIMIDGVKQTFEFFGSHPLAKAAVPVEAIERIEIIRGPMSVIYGSGAFFGAINIITRTENKTSRKNAAVTYGSLNSVRTSLNIQEMKNDLGFFLNASWNKTDGMNKPLNTMTDDTIYNIIGPTTTKDRLAVSERYFSLGGLWKDFSAQMNYTESTRGGYLFQPSGREGSISLLRSTSFNLNYKKRLSSELSFEGRFLYQHDWVNNDFDRDWAWIGRDSSLRHISDIYEYDQFENNAIEAEAIAFWQPVRPLFITAGLSYRGVTELHYRNDHPIYMEPIYYNAEWYLDNKAGITNLAPYLQIQYAPVENIKIIGGLRMQYTPDYSFNIRYSFDTASFTNSYFTNHYIHFSYKPDKIELVPRLALIYSLNDENILKILYGKAIKNPSFESVTDACTRGFKVHPEYIHTLEINYSTRLSQNFKAGGSVFMNYLDDLIVRKLLFEYLPNDTNLYSVLGNGANRKSLGGELSFTWNPFHSVSLQAAATYQKTSTQDPDADSLEVPYSPPLLAYLNLSWEPAESMKLTLMANYVDKMLTGWDPQRRKEDRTLGDYYGIPGKAYMNLGANLRWDPVLHSSWYVNVHVSNLLNTTQYYPTTNFSGWAEKGTLRPDRSILFTVGIKF